MSMSREYLALLNQHIEIAPANSQEEVQAAELIQQQMERGGLEVEQQPFQAPRDTRFFSGIVMAVFFVGVLLAGVGGIAFAVLGFVIAAVCLAAILLKDLGTDLVGRILPPAESQNVVGLHRGEGPASGRGVRPIVVMAHYDSGHEELLANPSVARFSGPIATCAPYGGMVAMACVFLQLIQAIPEPALRVLWVIGLVCALPLLALGVNNVASKFMPLTGAANDNNASVAALLGVMEDVFTDDAQLEAQRLEELGELLQEQFVAEPEPEMVAEAVGQPELRLVQDQEAPAAVRTVRRVVREAEPVVGVRHGKAVLEALGMLPESCQIVYVEPEPVVEEVEVVEETAVAEEPPATQPAVEVPSFLRQPQRSRRPQAAANAAPAQAPSVGEPQPRSQRQEADARELQEQFESTGKISGLRAVPRAEEQRDQVTWADTSVDPSFEVDSQEISEETSQDAESTMEMPLQSPQQEDAEWGKSTFRPQAVSVARRASLFDLPDPTEAQVDPLAPGAQMAPLDVETFSDVDYEMPGQAQQRRHPLASRATVSTAQRSYHAQTPDGSVQVRASHTVTTVQAAPEPSSPQAQPIEPVNVEGADDRHGRKGHGPSLRERLHLGRGKQADNAPADDWIDDDEWKGGAARAEGADVTEEEMMDEVLNMDYVNLIAHDIWFVATGASELDHAGAEAFINAHKKELRGAFLVNLDAIGAGDLTVITEEGGLAKRRVDRRLIKMLDRIARDLHMHMDEKPRGWTDTDATYAMRRSVRCATLMGCDPGTVPALVHTAEDVPENLDPSQVAQVNRLISELIRRA